jgi:hypothetical protein
MNKFSNNKAGKLARWIAGMGSAALLAMSLAGAPAMATVPETESVEGTVTSARDGYYVITESEHYRVVGLDVSDMAGMTVTVTGMVLGSDDDKEIHATSVEETQL